MNKNFGCGNGEAPLKEACSACKHQRRKCTPDCKLAPFFPSNRSKDFQSVHKVFGVCNTLKILNKLDTLEEKQRAVESLCWEASCRDNYPVDGALAFLNQQREEFQKERLEFVKERERLQKELLLAKSQTDYYVRLYQQAVVQYTEAGGINHQHKHIPQLMPSSHHLSQNNPPVYGSQEACLYPMPMSQAPPHYYHAPGMQQAAVGGTNSSVSGLSGVHNIGGGGQRTEVMVPQDQQYNISDTRSQTAMVAEEHKPTVSQGI